MRLKPRTAAFAAARMFHRYPTRPGQVGAGCLFVGSFFTYEGWETLGHFLLKVAALILGVCGVWWWFRHVARPHTTKALVRRRAELDQHQGGVASRLDIAEHASAAALRAKARVLRPSLRQLSWWERRRLDPAQVGVEVARLGYGWWGSRVYASCEDATFRIGGPRTGKTTSLICHGLDAPGALITTSTRLDIAEGVHAVRSARGAVHVFNPAGWAGLASTLRWRVLAGCEDFATAQRRAADLIPESTGEGERWDSQARRILALLLHAAETSGRTMRDVNRWISDPTPTSRDEVIDALLDVEPGGKDRASAARAFWATNDRTRTSITTTMATPLAWMSDDRARLLGDADRDDPALVDLAELINRGETLHMIGHEDNTSLSPLIGALVAEIAHAARTLASTHLSGRLDPPLTMLLDEAKLVCPVPLDRWTADMGGRGVTLHISVQSLSQLRQGWGDDGAGTILGNVASFLVFGGNIHAPDLRDISVLTGEHRMSILGTDTRPDHDDTKPDRTGNGDTTEHRWVPVLSPAQIRALGRGEVLLLHRGLHTVIGWAPQVQDRRGWKPVSLLPDTTPDSITLTTTPSRTRRLLTAVAAAPGRGVRVLRRAVVTAAHARRAARVRRATTASDRVIDVTSFDEQAKRRQGGAGGQQ